MSVVRVTAETKEFLAHLVHDGKAATLTDAVTFVCGRMTELEAKLSLESGAAEVGGKRERLSVGGDESLRRGSVSELKLSQIWQGMQQMKQEVAVPLADEELRTALGSNHFPCEWGSLLLQTPEVACRGQLSRVDVADFLVNGWKSSQAMWQQSCLEEMSLLNAEFGKWAKSESSAEALAVRFAEVCPTLENLFFSLVTSGSRVEDNAQKTVEFKRVTFVVLVAAIGKVRSKHNSECGKFLFRLWRTLGATAALNDCLASLGLSISSKRGKEEEATLIVGVANQIQHHTRRKGSSVLFFASCDNVDESFKSRLQQIGCRDESLHFINSTLYRFRLPLQNLSRERMREGVLSLSDLFATPEMERDLAALCSDNLARVLHPLIYGFVFQGKKLAFRGKAAAPELVSLGGLEKTKTYPLPTQNYSESNLNEFYEYEKGFLARFPEGEKVLVAADAKTYLLMKKSQKLRASERLEPLDCDDSKAIPVADWFHLSVCVFLGDCTRNNFGLLQQFCTLIGGSYVINAQVGKCMNDTMRVFNAFYPVAVARLFQYFLTEVAEGVGLNPPSVEFQFVVNRFWLWIVYTTRVMKADAKPVREFQRHCRLVLIMAVYHVTWESTRCANHDALMHIMHWIVPIVCQGPFSQYRSVVVDSLAYYHRSSEEERFLYKHSFTVNHTGRAFGNTPTGKVQEYLNKKTKEAKRRDPTRKEDMGGETALLQHDRDVEERVRFIFPHLHDPSEGMMSPPDARVVLDLAKRVHWTPLKDEVLGKDASQQKPLCGLQENEDVIRKVIRRIGRAAQFGLHNTEGESGSEDESDDSE